MIATIISNNNAKVLAPTQEQPKRECNCRQPTSCPLNGQCLTECVVYKASVSTANKPVRYYHGLTEGPFKTRYNAHMRSFRAEVCKRETELSKYIWDLKDQNLDYEIKWSIIQRATPYKCGTRRCDVCLAEKVAIATANSATSLNKRAEIVSTCRHRAKFRYAKLRPAPD